MVQLLIPAAAALAAEFFPSLIGKLAGQRAEEVAEKVVKTAAAAAGVPGSTDPEEIGRRLKADRQAEAKARLQLARLDQTEHARILEDREHARARDARFLETGRDNRRADVMLALSFVGLIACVLLVVLPATHLGSAELALVTTVAGALLKMISDAFAFEFGSSKGSKAKDRQIDDIQRALVEVAKERNGGMRAAAARQADPAMQKRETPSQDPTFVDRLMQKQL
jgi:hypothetical protein